MSPEAFHELALSLPGATFDVKWGADRVYSVGGRMFAVAGHQGEAAPKYAFKASDIGFEALVEQGVAVPAPYMARAKWVQLRSHDAVSDDDLCGLVANAHALIAAKLTRKARAELGIG